MTDQRPLPSRGHARAGVDFDDRHFITGPYDKWVAYGQAKSANALFAVGLDVRGIAHGVRAFSVHPGVIVTDLMRAMSEDERRRHRALGQPIRLQNRSAGSSDERLVRHAPTARRRGRRLLRRLRHRGRCSRGLQRAARRPALGDGPGARRAFVDEERRAERRQSARLTTGIEARLT